MGARVSVYLPETLEKYIQVKKNKFGSMSKVIQEAIKIMARQEESRLLEEYYKKQSTEQFDGLYKAQNKVLEDMEDY